jgi:2-keto-3-deoxy-L-rhamnonate aldolase RhmA
MRSFGDAFCLTLLTDDPLFAATADRAGLDRIGLDLERLGKTDRQAGQDTRLSEHRMTDLAVIGGAIRNAALFARLNPVHDGTDEEVETALSLGAKVLMLPYFRTVREVETFTRLVARRARVVILVETAPALTRIRDILAVPGIDEVMAGLNDLRLALGVRNHFEVLASPLLDALAAETHRAGLAFSVGGVSRPDDALPVPPDLVLAQYPRLQATGAWLSRSFVRNLPDDVDLAVAVASIRRRLTEWAAAPAPAHERARDELGARARALAT